MTTIERIEQLERCLVDLTEVAKKDDKPVLERWKPKPRPFFSYYYISGDGHVEGSNWLDKNWDKARHKAYNCFETHEEAEAELLRTTAWRKLRWLARELYYPSNHIFVMCSEGKTWLVKRIPTECCLHLGMIYFPSQKTAEYALAQMTSEELEVLK
jgi:hypothetical protein